MLNLSSLYHGDTKGEFLHFSIIISFKNSDILTIKMDSLILKVQTYLNQNSIYQKTQSLSPLTPCYNLKFGKGVYSILSFILIVLCDWRRGKRCFFFLDFFCLLFPNYLILLVNTDWMSMPLSGRYSSSDYHMVTYIGSSEALEVLEADIIIYFSAEHFTHLHFLKIHLAWL